LTPLKETTTLEGGKCVLTFGSTEPLYYATRALKAGMILVLHADEVLASFTSGEREWEFGVDASVAVAKVCAGEDIDTTNHNLKETLQDA
jgi:hypothetical protein